jgi:hypothetical protein
MFKTKIMENETEVFHCRHCNVEVFGGHMFCPPCEREIDELANSFDDEEE